MYSNCFEWNLSKEQTVVNLFAMLLLKVCLCLTVFITVSLHYRYYLKYTNTSFSDPPIWQNADTI